MRTHARAFTYKETHTSKLMTTLPSVIVSMVVIPLLLVSSVRSRAWLPTFTKQVSKIKKHRFLFLHFRLLYTKIYIPHTLDIVAFTGKNNKIRNYIFVCTVSFVTYVYC